MSGTSRNRRRRAIGRSATLLAVVLLVGWTGGCAAAPDVGLSLEAVDSLFAELGGAATADLSRGQRWRMISSIGAGLPPRTFTAEDLPEPRSRGAGYVQMYCERCHWLPAPQMHSADEWPRLMRRMTMRAQTLSDRMGGPLTAGLLGEVLLEGMRHAAVPSPAETDTLLAYLQAHALRVATPGELGAGPEAEFFVERCSICHDTPSPRSHTAAGWPPVVARMAANMALMDVQPLTGREIDRIIAHLVSQAAQ